MYFQANKNLFPETGANDLCFLILDYNRPAESLVLLNSIKRHVKFQHKVIFYSNGGIQDYAFDFFQKGLIDTLVLNKLNEGSSIGTIRLTEICYSKYFINLQCDNYLIRDFYLEEAIDMARTLEETDAGAIDFAMVGNQVFSERAFMSRVDFYSRNPFFSAAGTGPFQSDTLPNSEQAMTKWLQVNNKKIRHWPNRLIADNGKYAVLEIGQGVFKRRTDTQELSILKTPKEKAPAFNLTDAEWDIILKGDWADWRIPEKSREWVFHFYSNDFENPSNEIYRKK